MSRPALADAPPPPEIQAILAKMKAGVPPTTAEQAQLQAWQSHKLGKAEGGGPDAGLMPDDIQALFKKIQQGGMPTKEDTARLQEGKTPIEGQPGQNCSNAVAAEIEVATLKALFKRQISDAAVYAKVLDNQIKVTVQHEVGHMIEITHHEPAVAPPMCIMRYWGMNSIADALTPVPAYCDRCYKLIDPKCDPVGEP